MIATFANGKTFVFPDSSRNQIDDTGDATHWEWGHAVNMVYGVEYAERKDDRPAEGGSCYPAGRPAEGGSCYPTNRWVTTRPTGRTQMLRALGSQHSVINNR